MPVGTWRVIDPLAVEYVVAVEVAFAFIVAAGCALIVMFAGLFEAVCTTGWPHSVETDPADHVLHASELGATIPQRQRRPLLPGKHEPYASASWLQKLLGEGIASQPIQGPFESPRCRLRGRREPTIQGHDGVRLSTEHCQSARIPGYRYRRLKLRRFGILTMNKQTTKLLLVVLLIVGAVAPNRGVCQNSRPEPKPSTYHAESDIRAILERRFDAVHAKSIAEIEPLYGESEDLLVFRNNRVVHGWSGYRQLWEVALTGLPKNFQAKTTDLTIRVGTDLSWATALFTISHDDDNGKTTTRDGFMTFVLENHNGVWHIVHEHISWRN